MPQVWCEYAVVGDAVKSAVTITIDGAQITSVVEDTQPGVADQRLVGLTMPGFANAHSHAFHRGLRGRTHSGSGDFWTWREQMYALAARLDPDSYRELATAVFGEMLLAGMTCVGEFHYLHHAPGGQRYSARNAMGQALIDGANAAGIRLTLLDTCYLQGGFNQPVSPSQLRFSDGTVHDWAERSAQLTSAGQVLIGAAVHSMRAVPPEAVQVVAEIAQHRQIPLHAHVSEQPAENTQTHAAYGCTPTQLLSRNGALDSNFTAIHATHLEPIDIQLLGESGCAVGLCPTTERDLADGIGPSGALSAAGARLCIGSDSHAVVDPFEELRAIELNQRLAHLSRGHHRSSDLMTAGTVNGYRSLGWGGGTLAAGMLADLCTIGLTSVRLAGCDPMDLVGAAIFSATAADVHHVMVGGKTVVSDGQHCTVSVAATLSQSIERLWSAR